VRTEKGFTSKGQQHRKKRRVGRTKEGTFTGVVAAGGRGRGHPCCVPHGPDSRGGGHRVGIRRGSVDRERVYAPTWAGSLSKLGQNVSANWLNSPDTYRLKYPICLIYFIFGYSLDIYPWRIGYVSLSDTYPSRIGEFGSVLVFCRWHQ
jgi:hypothetical protein